LLVLTYAFSFWLSACRHDGEAMTDERLTQLVKQAFVEDEMNLLEVDVNTERGTVYLSGEVRDGARKIRAEDVARGVQGIQQVVNKIALEP
jgi:hyperosmotically inducible protein